MKYLIEGQPAALDSSVFSDLIKCKTRNGMLLGRNKLFHIF